MKDEVNEGEEMGEEVKIEEALVVGRMEEVKEEEAEEMVEEVKKEEAMVCVCVSGLRLRMGYCNA